MKNLLLLNKLNIKKGGLLTALFIMPFFNGFTQINLISNGSFEMYTSCPENSNLLSNATGWINPTTATPDFFHTCSTIFNYDVPYQGIYNYQVPEDGNGYVRIGVFGGSNIHEYIQTALIDSLNVNQVYFFRCYASLADFSYYCTKDFGAYFSTNAVTSSDYYNLNFSPQIKSNQFLCDTLNWLTVSGYFIAGGGDFF